ncbi:MAG: hypothetical protein KBD19_01345 [Candidatus Moranbacteria bacterium]|nr:hypothetical protein [Candidatus Moranbacteria bacterium]
MTKLYLDIDGTLIRRGVPAEGIAEFLVFATEHFDCYWLSTHCQGDAKAVFLYLVGKLPGEAIPHLRKIKATSWDTLKTEAIDFSGPFFWLDDHLFDAERQMLVEYGALDRHILIDLVADPRRLLRLIDELRTEE